MPNMEWEMAKSKDIRDVVYVDPEKFDKLKTKQIAKEISELNCDFEAQGTEIIF